VYFRGGFTVARFAELNIGKRFVELKRDGVVRQIFPTGGCRQLATQAEFRKQPFKLGEEHTVERQELVIYSWDRSKGVSEFLCARHS
jgi:hypothetical protein